ncbi:purine-nucleoside phosphorylase [Paludisphaera mucosa]|uniref:Purine nucleoside phosphorylase n=1 Tax=Paludisphaera mucosa TaxID=3030827 RepID=A0ABT6F8A9_9BACT|nr:purine-nucleoside phosphorylase [Paludisphaera mucosa]MDG3003832.1 purine-nucleoside phosphorylase [Paludisphaera mucosa]
MSPTSQNPDLVAKADEAAEVIRQAAGGRPPRIAIVLGSGLNGLVDRFDDRKTIPYAQIPFFPTPTVQGHAGNVVLGSIDGADVLTLQGRFHYYEGYDLRTITFPMRVLQRLGVQQVILTAATGGVRSELRPGNLVCLSDHLNLIGSNPLRGPADPRLGERFPDMSEVYSKRLRNMAKEEAKRLGVHLVSAVYACLPGPSYETPAEIRMLRTLGADVVGMSTVPEAIVARHGGMDVLGLALVTNAAAGVLPAPIRHEDVLEAGRKATPMLGKLIRRVVLRLAGVAPGNVGFSGEFPTYRQD